MVFSEFSVWSFVLAIAALLASMVVVAILKRFIPFLRKSLIPTSVLGGIVLLLISTITYYAAGEYLFNLRIFNPQADGFALDGMEILELITYHCLGIGFVAMGMRGSKKKFTKKRANEIFDSGLVTVNSYLLQGIFGLVVTIIAVCAFHTEGLIEAAGILLAFGFGQGTGQALNYGTIYEDSGLVGGGNFGLTIAAMGFLVACLVGVVYLNVLRRKGIIKIKEEEAASSLSDYEDEDEIPVVSSMDKMTVQIAIVFLIYAVSYLCMAGLAMLIPSMKNVLFGFNFLIGTLLTIPVKAVLNKLTEKKVIKKQIVNNFMMNRIGGFAFDLMIVAGVAAIKLPLLKDHWGILVILAVVGAIVTCGYVFVTSKIFCPEYRHEQFLAMFGMLTGTASTGMILLREIDGSYRTPASENLVYQSVPAMVFGLPIMFLATYAAAGRTECLITFGILIAFFAVLNVLLFRKQIFRRRGKAVADESGTDANGESLAVETEPESDGDVSAESAAFDGDTPQMQ